MNLEQLQDDVWSRMSVQKHVAGRRIVNRITKRAVRQFPAPVLQHCTAAEAQAVGVQYTRTIARQARQEYGMGIVLMLVLGAIVQEVVKILIQWWMDNRSEMLVVMRECGHDD